MGPSDTINDCCVTRGGGGYIGVGSEECFSCMDVTGKLMSRCITCVCVVDTHNPSHFMHNNK